MPFFRRRSAVPPAPTPQTVTPDERSQFHDAALLTEYNAIHQEAMQGFAGVQSIMQWSLGTIGAVVAGGLIFSSQNAGLDSGHAVALVIVFGVALPWLSTFASWVWLGEVWRIVRISAYLRAVEQAVERRSEPITPPMQWYRMIAWGPATGSARLAVSRVGYFGGLGIYLGTVVVSVCVAARITDRHLDAFDGWSWLLDSNFVAVAVVSIGMALVQGILIQRHEKAFEFAAEGRRFSNK